MQALLQTLSSEDRLDPVNKNSRVKRSAGAKLRVFPHLLLGMVAAADHRAGFYVSEAFGFAARFPSGELVRVHPALDGQVLRGRLEVLAQREDLTADRHEIVDHRFDLIFGFSQA